MRIIPKKKIAKESGCLKILILLSQLYLMPKSVILLGEESESSRNGYINELLEKEYIREFKVGTVRPGSRYQRQTTFVVLTPAGFRFLIETGEVDYLSSIPPEKTKGLSILTSTYMERERFYLIAESASMASAIGAKVPLLAYNYQAKVTDFLDESLAERNSHFVDMENYEKSARAKRVAGKRRLTIASSDSYISTLIGKAVREFREISGKDPDQYDEQKDDYIRWYLPEIVKLRYISTMINGSDPGYDIQRARFTGLLQSGVRSLLTYGCHSVSLSWPRSLAEKEQSCLLIWMTGLKEETRKKCLETGPSSCLFIPNPRTLKALWRDRSKKGHTYTHLGAGQSHLYVIPLCADGAAQLRMLMLQSDEEILQEHRRKILEDGMGTALRFTDLFPYSSPMVTEEGEAPSQYLICDLTLLDICRLRKVEEFHRKYPNEKIACILYDWEIPYLSFFCEENQMLVIAYSEFE